MPTLAELTDAYMAGAAKVRAVVVGMTPDQLRARPVYGKWSTLEVVAHLADFEPIYVERMKRTIALSRPIVLGADENEFAIALAYQQRDIAEELDVIEASRKAFGRVLRSLPEASLQKMCVHSERGLLSLAQLLTSVNGHVAHHVAFIVEKKKALGLA